eukprot:2394517-Amphidinium_carterae.1
MTHMPRDMPMHEAHHLETGLFPLHFQKQLLAYYDESIAYMCDTSEDYSTLQNHFTAIDLKHGDKPDEPDEMNTDSHVLAALVMDDYDHQDPSSQVFSNVNFRDTLDAEGRIREAGLLLEVPANQVQQAVVYAQERIRSYEVQQNERYVLHRPSDMTEVTNLLLRAPATEADVRAARQFESKCYNHACASGPTSHPPVTEVSAPAFLGTTHKLEVPTTAEPAAAASTTPTPVNLVKAVPKTPPPTLLPPPEPQPAEQVAAPGVDRNRGIT